MTIASALSCFLHKGQINSRSNYKKPKASKVNEQEVYQVTNNAVEEEFQLIEKRKLNNAKRQQRQTQKKRDEKFAFWSNKSKLKLKLEAKRHPHQCP